MILQEFPTEWDFWVRLSLFIVFIVILIIGSIYLLKASQSVEYPTTKKILQGYAFFGFCFSLTRIFFILSTFELISIAPATNSLYNNIYVVIAYTVTMASIVFVFRVVENYILQQKPIFTTFALISFLVDVLALVLTIFQINIGTLPSKDLALWIQTIIGPILGIAICVLYIRVIQTSTGDVRKQAIQTLVGIILILAGILLDSSLISTPEAYSWIRAITTPIIFIFGVLLVFKSLISNIKQDK